MLEPAMDQEDGSEVADQDKDKSLFLLPFSEVPDCQLVQPLREAQDYESDEEQSEENAKSLYAECLLKRTVDMILENGTVADPNAKEFRLQRGCHLLLRPIENSLRPCIGKAVQFWTSKESGKSKEQFVRVKWFYRAEDLTDKPTEAIGEDEVFESEHFDDVQIQAIAGRCEVTSYSEWVAAKLKDREGRLQSSNGIQKVSDSDIDVLSDTESSFGDNYSSAAVHYYCKRFYDPIKQRFAVSRFEDEYANPAEELRGNGPADDEFEPDVSVTSSDDSMSDVATSEEDEVWNSTRKRKRSKKRPRRKANGINKEGGPNKVSQFSLPTDSGAPDILPCRDEQKERVRRFLEDAIRESAEGGHGGSRCLYISGVPGTGKTATVREVVRGLARRRASGEVAPFEAIEVNAMSLPDPNLVYSELYSAITGSSGLAPMHAAQLLEKRFSDEPSGSGKSGRNSGVGGPTAREKGKCIILILDEMDVLVSRKQKVLYDMLEWPTRKDARMAVIGIANTMDLPERMLPRLGSRLGLNRLTYPPYTSNQLITILNLKLEGRAEVKFDPVAIRLCAQKVGAVSGDVRRALEIIRRAIELANVKQGKRKAKKTVTAEHINKAFHDIAGGSRLVAINQLSLFERLFLVCAVSLAMSEGSFAIDVTCSMNAISLKAIDEARRHSKFFETSGIPTMFELEDTCWRLSAQRIILVEQAAAFKTSRVIVNVSADDCSFALQDCELSQLILKPKSTL